MKKKILLILMLICTLNVNAAPLYSDYNFIGYTLEPLNNSENYRYKPIKVHRYYSIRETNVIYAGLDDDISISPYVDKNNTIDGKYYLGGKSKVGLSKPKVYMKLKENYQINTINITNFYSYDFNVYEIEIFSKNDKINYQISDNVSFLNDGDINSGSPLKNENFQIKLDKYYDIKDIRITVHYYADLYLLDYFTIEYVNDNGDNYLALIRLDNYGSDHAIESLEFKVGDNFVDFLLNYHILGEESAMVSTLNTVYEYSYPLYKHYNLEKIYYINSIENEIDGYTYDENEDITIYEVYAREYLGNEQETVIGNNLNDEVPKKNVKKTSSTDNFIYQVIPVNNVEKIENETCVQEECKCDCTTEYIIEEQAPEKEEQENTKSVKIVLITVIVLCLILCIFKLIQLLCDKFTKKI